MWIIDMCNRFLIFAILKTDYTCYALRFFSLSQMHSFPKTSSISSIWSATIIVEIGPHSLESKYFEWAGNLLMHNLVLFQRVVKIDIGLYFWARPKCFDQHVKVCTFEKRWMNGLNHFTAWQKLKRDNYLSAIIRLVLPIIKTEQSARFGLLFNLREVCNCEIRVANAEQEIIFACLYIIIFWDP